MIGVTTDLERKDFRKDGLWNFTLCCPRATNLIPEQFPAFEPEEAGDSPCQTDKNIQRVKRRKAEERL